MSLINIEKTITLDVYDYDTTPSVVKAIQLDKGTRTVYAGIQNSRQDYDIGQNATVSLTVLRPDKTKVQIIGETFVSSTGADGTIYGAKAYLSDVALAVKGNLKAQFKITSGEQELRTEVFTVSTGEALDAGDGDWAGDLDGHNLDEMAQDIEDTKTAVSEMETDVSELKEDLSDADFAIKQEKARAESEESRIEALFTAPTQEAVDKWLDEHPEATTTVLDGSITDTKLSDGLKGHIQEKSDAPIVQTDEDYSHTDLSNPLSATVKGNQYGFGTVKYVNAENAWRKAGGSGDFANGVTWTYADRFLVLNGTCTAEASKSVFSGQPLFKQLPAGNYKMVVLVNFGNSTINRKYQGASATRIGLYVQGAGGSTSYTVANDKYFHEGYNEIDFTIDFKATIARWKQFTFANDVYDNCRIWIGVYPQNAVISETEYADLENGASVNVALPFGNGYSAVDFMQYPSVITSAISVESYFRRMTAYITPEHFYGGIIPNSVDASTYIQSAIDYAGNNGVKCVALGKYTTTVPIVFDKRKVSAEINQLVYTGDVSAIQISAKEVNLDFNGLNSSADGIQLIGNGSTKNASHCSINLLYGICTGDVIQFTGTDDNVDLISGNNSYNKISVQKGVSYNGSVIHIKQNSGAAENHIYGAYVETTTDAAIKALHSSNYFYNFSIEHTAYRGILTCGGNNYIDIRTVENENHMHETGRYFCKVIGYHSSNVIFRGKTNSPAPSSFDVSDVVVPPEDYGTSKSGYMYGLIVEQPVVTVQNFMGHMASYYYDQTKYNNTCYEYYYNFEKKLICKPAMYNSILDITAANVDMNMKDVVNYIDILADTTITLSPSYCAEGVNRLIVKQDNGFSATIINDNGDTIFDGANRGSGVYAINFYAKKIPFIPNPNRPDDVWYTYFFGKNSQALIEKLS